MALVICVLFLLFCFRKVTLATGQTSGCGSIPWCQTSVNNNCMCYKISPDDKYGICTCTYSYSLETVIENGVRECCLMSASFGESCSNKTQCSANLVCTSGICQCNGGCGFNNETETCVATSTTDYREITVTVAVGTTCIVLTLIVVLLILIFMHRRAKTERQLSYLRHRINTRGPYPHNVQKEEMTKETTPPSYDEIERGETPPPPFESLDCIFENHEDCGSE